MDLDKRARRQSLRIIISEAIMVLAVALLVIILAFVVSGYWLGSDFKVERQGMLQIYSTPTGANVAVDGDAPWFQRTNTSKVLSGGEHEVVLTQDGYDSWSKTVSISEGLLYRLHYPRLFLTERTAEPVYNFSNVTFSTVSRDHNNMVVVDSGHWRLLKLNSDSIESKLLDFSALFGDTFNDNVTAARWAGDNNHLLVSITTDSTPSWYILNIKTPAQSLDLTSTLGAVFTDVRIVDDSANTLLTLIGTDLYKIDVPARELTATPAKAVESYHNYGNEIVYTAITGNSQYSVNLLSLGDDKITTLRQTTADVRPYLSRFYDDKYFTFITADSVAVYKYADFSEVTTAVLPFSPTTVKLGIDGEYVFMARGTDVITLDMEALSTRTWQLDSASYGWLDADMLYAVDDSTLIVYDFDGLNRRSLSPDVSFSAPVTITDNKWLYYEDIAHHLVREIIAK